MYYVQQSENQILEENIIQNEIIVDEINFQQNKTEQEILLEIDEKYNQIEDNKSEFIPAKREWQQSGPFKIDRKEYRLGEKIFFMAEGIEIDQKGEIIFLRPVNETHYKIWGSYPFDGKVKSAFNIYFEPMLSKFKKICTSDDLIGQWTIVFKETSFNDLNFKINEKIIPGVEDDFNKKVC